jgi:flagellar biosynthesis chaperone FliJ
VFGFTSKNNAHMQLKVSVYDTYVPKKQGGVMHFDILVDSNEKDLEKIYEYGKAYLHLKGQEGQPLTSKECRFCHVENAKGPIEDSIRAKGYYIIEMEGCQ